MYNAGFASDAAARAGGQAHEPLEFTLHGVGEKLRAIERAVGAADSLIYISHPVNFREQFFPEYKMNRNVDHKPHWYNEIQDYLFKHKGAIYSDLGDEADDALGIHQMDALAHDEETVICTIDKDLDLIPGLHYNFSPTKKADGVYDMDDPECLRLFYKQMITGDTADNIPGLFKRKGKKAMAKYQDPLNEMTRSKDMWDHVNSVYGEGEEDFLANMGKLLYIKRESGERGWWSPPI